MITAFLSAYAIELAFSSIFIAGVAVYGKTKIKGGTNKHKLVYYDISDRVIKAKKIQQNINDRSGGVKKSDTFFKGSK